jgi:hypothetical protein
LKVMREAPPPFSVLNSDSAFCIQFHPLGIESERRIEN